MNQVWGKVSPRQRRRRRRGRRAAQSILPTTRGKKEKTRTRLAVVCELYPLVVFGVLFGADCWQPPVSIVARGSWRRDHIPAADTENGLTGALCLHAAAVRHANAGRAKPREQGEESWRAARTIEVLEAIFWGILVEEERKRRKVYLN